MTTPVPTIPVHDASDPRIGDYLNIRDADLQSRRGAFIAEGRFIVRTFLSGSRFKCRSVLVTPLALESIADALNEAAECPPVFTASQAVMNQVAGFDVHRGCLAVGERGEALSESALLAHIPAGPAVVLVLEGLTNHDNVGGIFRSALAMGASGVLLSPSCCDPLYRKSIRVSMGAALHLPFARSGPLNQSVQSLKAGGFTIAALHTGADAVDIHDYALRAAAHRRIALLVGTEGAGLSEPATAAADVRLRIAMRPEVDSLNAVVACSIALHRLGPLA